MKATANRDLFRESDAARARAARIAADTARHDPYWTEAEREQRAAHYERLARELERRNP